jgi:hypothetical protein
VQGRWGDGEMGRQVRAGLFRYFVILEGLLLKPARQLTPGATTRETRKGALAPLCRETLTFAYPLPSEAVPTEAAPRLPRLGVYTSHLCSCYPPKSAGSPPHWLPYK